MQVNLIQSYKQNFKSNNQSYRFGYDDSISLNKRELLREDILERSMPYYSILENNKRLEKYELKKLISSLCGQKVNQNSLQNIFRTIHKPIKENNDTINHNIIEELPLYNLDLVYKKLNVYRGETLEQNTYAIKVLKQAGIERIVDLIGYETLENDCKNLGLEYFKYPMNPYVFNQRAMFKTESENKQILLSHCTRFGYKEKNANNYVNKRMNEWRKQKDTELENFVKFIQTMQKGKLYIGCEYGTYTTDNALMLNSIFNPVYNERNCFFTATHRIYLNRVEKLYQNLTKEHKLNMGWSEEFDKIVQSKLKKLIKFL